MNYIVYNRKSHRQTLFFIETIINKTVNNGKVPGAAGVVFFSILIVGCIYTGYKSYWKLRFIDQIHTREHMFICANIVRRYAFNVLTIFSILIR